MKNRVVIGGRYQYSPIQVIRQTSTYTQYRAYDRVTKRDLQLQIHRENNELLETLRDIKHPFIQTIFDMVQLQQDTQVAILLESGVQANLQQVLKRNHFLKEHDAVVIMKYILLAIKELHDKLIVCNSICPQNIGFCTYSLIKLCFSAYKDQPIQTLAPQILRSERATFATDIFSLGTVLYKMLYGIYPFQGEDEDDLLSKIKSKKFQKPETVSPFSIIISKQIYFLLTSMLDFYPENRPSLDSVLQTSLFSFHIDTELQQYVKPKGSIIPEPFFKKYLVFRASKIVDRIDEYYEESSYLALKIQEKEFVTLYAPDVKMFQADPRKSESYYEKIRALKQAYSPDSCSFLCRVDDFQRFRRQPVLVTEYCNQGDLFTYLEKRQKHNGWLKQKQIYIIMYLMALGYRQMREIGVTSIHTVHSHRIMIRNMNIKIREPGILTPFIQSKMYISKNIDYFAPQLKNKKEFVSLDKSDIWSFGVLFYFLLAKKMPAIEINEQQQSAIPISSLETNRKNKNLIGKCLNSDSNQRIDLQQIKIQGVDESLLQQMLEEKNNMKQNIDDDDSQNEEKYRQNKHIIFKSRKKKWCKNYNKVLAYSSTANCRIWIKLVLSLITFWILSFGLFFINGGMGLLKTNYYRPITLSVPYNYGTAKYDLTILSTDGKNIETTYSEYSYEQFTIDLNCSQNYHSANSTVTVDSYINGASHSIQCLFGFIFAILFSIIYGITAHKLDMPFVIVQRKQKKTNKNLYHMILMYFMHGATLFCFFYIFALEFQIQMQPCFGLENQSYPAFTSIETLLNGQVGLYFAQVFPTVILWALIMIIYNFVTLLAKKANARVFEWKMMIPTLIIMLAYTVICRIGFASPVPLEPTWTYQMNFDIINQFWGLFGFFPEIIIVSLFILERLIDLVFWFFLRLGMEPQQQSDINKVSINLRLEPEEEVSQQNNNQQSKVNLIQNDFEIFD